MASVRYRSLRVRFPEVYVVPEQSHGPPKDLAFSPEGIVALQFLLLPRPWSLVKGCKRSPPASTGQGPGGKQFVPPWPRWELSFPGPRAPLSGGLTLQVSTALTPPAPCFRSPPSLPLGCTSCSLSSSLLCFLSPFVGVLEALSPDVSRSGLRRWPGFSRNLHV